MEDFNELLGKMRRRGGIQMMAFVVGVMVAYDSLTTLASLWKPVTDTQDMFPSS